MLNKSKDINSLDSNFHYILTELAKDINNPIFSRIEDPANSTNILSDLLTITEKNKIITKAKESSKKQFWKDIVF